MSKKPITSTRMPNNESAIDPENPPLTAEQLSQLKPVQIARPLRALRQKLGLTQEDFAMRYRIPLGTLRDWEQGRAEPDQATRAYLAVIGRDPEAVARALAPQAEPA